MAKSIKEIIKELEQGTFRVKKKGKKFFVEDVVDYGDGVYMTEKEMRQMYG
jgi:hypothetical protein